MTNYAIIAGSGRLPEILLEKTNAKIIAFEGQDLANITPDLITNIGMIGSVLDFLKDNNIEKLIFAGGIKKPNISEIKTDMVGKKLLAKILMGNLFSKKLPGDNALLGKIVKFIESEGYKVVGAHEVLPELLAQSGAIAGSADGYEESIKLGIIAAKKLGEQDIGQAVVVDQANIITEEDASGTKELIARSKSGVLVKCKKPQQDDRVDLPTIGVETIEQLKQSGLVGVAVEAGASLILDKQDVIKKANEAGIFVIGV